MQAQMTQTLRSSIADFQLDLPIVGFYPNYSYGIEVGIVQRLLVFYQQLSEANVTGGYEQITANAVQQIQNNQGIPQQGIVDPETWCVLASLAVATSTPTPPVLHFSLNSVVQAYPNDLPQLSQLYPNDPAPYLSVAVLQSLLTLYGYLQPDSAGNPSVDGQFGTITDAAVRAFQTDLGLAVDGIVGAQTWAALANFAVILD